MFLPWWQSRVTPSSLACWTCSINFPLTVTSPIVWTGQHDTEFSLQFCGCNSIKLEEVFTINLHGYPPIAGSACPEVFSSLPKLTRYRLWTDDHDPASQFYHNTDLLESYRDKVGSSKCFEEWSLYLLEKLSNSVSHTCTWKFSVLEVSWSFLEFIHLIRSFVV